MSGKGDKRRPTDEAAYADNYERIFGNGVHRLPGTQRGGETATQAGVGQGKQGAGQDEAVSEMDAAK